MKLNSLSVHNFLGARYVAVSLLRPVTLFAGENGSGKSSLMEAIRMALTGESVRVGQKKDYRKLLTEGTENGFSSVCIEGDMCASVVLPSGRAEFPQYVPHPTLPYVLDAQRFASLPPNERRNFLFGLMSLRTDEEAITKRLRARGCDAQKIGHIAPYMRSGFDTAHTEAKSKAREEKAAWRTLTGQTYGKEKAATWTAEVVADVSFDEDALDTLKRRFAAADDELAAENQKLGALRIAHERFTESAKKLALLRDKSRAQDRIAKKLVHDAAELKQWEIRVQTVRQMFGGVRKVGLIHDLAFFLNESLKMVIPFGEMDAHQRKKLDEANDVLKKYTEEHGSIEAAVRVDTEEMDKLPEYENALRLMQRSVVNDKRDLSEAEASARILAKLEADIRNVPDEAAIEATKQATLENLKSIEARRKSLSADLDEALHAVRQASQAKERTERAFAAHTSVLAWSAIADALAPDGIPGEILAEALAPINDRLQQSANIAKWPQVSIRADMSILCYFPYPSTNPDIEYFPRDYTLLSESEKWRADAMIAEAIAHISGLKLLVLDRFDVLDLFGRQDLIRWLDALAETGEIDTALLFGTLKAPAKNLPDCITAYWLQNGFVALGEAFP